MNEKVFALDTTVLLEFTESVSDQVLPKYVKIVLAGLRTSDDRSTGRTKSGRLVRIFSRAIDRAQLFLLLTGIDGSGAIEDSGDDEIKRLLLMPALEIVGMMGPWNLGGLRTMQSHKRSLAPEAFGQSGQIGAIRRREC